MTTDDEMDSSSSFSESYVLVIPDMGEGNDSLDDGSRLPRLEELVDDGLERGGVVEELGSVSGGGDTRNGWRR